MPCFGVLFFELCLPPKHKKAASRGGDVVLDFGHKKTVSKDGWNCYIRIESVVIELTRFGDDLLSHALRRSTISATALNGRVRDGIGCFAGAMITKPRKFYNVYLPYEVSIKHETLTYQVSFLLLSSQQTSLSITGSNQAYRAISISQLNVLRHLHL